MVPAVRYPVEWIDRFQLGNGAWVTLRPVLPQDSVLEQLFVRNGLTVHSRYQRFQTGLRELPEALLRDFTEIDYHDHFALIAETFEGGQQQQVGDARFVRDAGSAAQAEFGLAVADAWQGLGLGRRLLERLAAAACAEGVAHLYGDVLRDNTAMLGLAEASGFTRRRHPDNASLLRLWRTLPCSAATAPELIAGSA